MLEAKTRLMDIKNIKDNENVKFLSIKSDFDNQNFLVKKKLPSENKCLTARSKR